MDFRLPLALTTLSLFTLTSPALLAKQDLSVFFDAPRPGAVTKKPAPKPEPQATEAPKEILHEPIASTTEEHETEAVAATQEEPAHDPIAITQDTHTPETTHEEVVQEEPQETHTEVAHEEKHEAPEKTIASHTPHADHEVDPDIAEALESLKIEPPKKHGEILLRRARLATKYENHNYRKAEKLYLEALKYDLTSENRKDLLLELANIYERVRLHSKVAIIYEKFLNQFPEEPSTPQILIRLGRIYRDMGAYKMANERFYDVLDMSLKIHEDQLTLYKYLSIKAQLEIADTYFIMGEYEKVTKLFGRMKGTELDPEEQVRMQFKAAYAQYHLKEYEDAATKLNAFIETFPESDLNPEARFILANTYRQMNQLDKAIATVIALIRYEEPTDPKGNANWLYWKRKTANELANDFYEQSDFISALKIYQTMAQLSKTPEWQWPVIYQIGRCFERLQMHDKATESYELILSGKEWEDVEYEMTPPLQTIRKTTEWRLNHLKWLESSNDKLSNIIKPSLSKNSSKS